MIPGGSVMCSSKKPQADTSALIYASLFLWNVINRRVISFGSVGKARNLVEMHFRLGCASFRSMLMSYGRSCA